MSEPIKAKLPAKIENPATWTDVIKTINDAILHHTAGVNAGTTGLSLPAYIAAKLKEKGHLKEEPKQGE